MKKLFITILLFYSVLTYSQILPGVVASQGSAAGSGAVYTDDFESYGTFAFGTEETLTGKGNWIAGAAGKAQILGNDGAGDSYISADLLTAYGTLIYNDVFADDQYSQLVLDVLGGTTSKEGVGVRLSGSGATLDGYIMLCRGTSGVSGRIDIYRIDDGVATSLNYYIATRTNDDVIKLTITGTTLRGYINGVIIDWDDSEDTEITDATYASGKAGISGYNWSNDTIGDDWEGGDL